LNNGRKLVLSFLYHYKNQNLIPISIMFISYLYRTKNLIWILYCKFAPCVYSLNRFVRWWSPCAFRFGYSLSFWSHCRAVHFVYFCRPGKLLLCPCGPPSQSGYMQWLLLKTCHLYELFIYIRPGPGM